MRRETAVVLLAGGAIAVVVYNRTPAGHARLVGLLGVLFPKSRAGTGEVTGLRLQGPIDVPGYGQGIDHPGVATLLWGTPDLPYSGGGGMVGDSNVSVAVAGSVAVAPSLSSIAVGGLGVAPQDMTPAQFAAVALAKSLPFGQAQKALMSGNLLGALMHAVAGIIGQFANMPVAGRPVAGIVGRVTGLSVRGSNALGSNLANVGRQVLSAIGVAVPGLPGVVGLMNDLAAKLADYSIARARNAQSEAFHVAIAQQTEAMLADPSLIGTNLAATPAQIANNPNAQAVTAGPYAGSYVGQAGAVAGNPGAAAGLPGFTTAPMGFARDTVAANGLPLFGVTNRGVGPDESSAPGPAATGEGGPTANAPAPAAPAGLGWSSPVGLAIQHAIQNLNVTTTQELDLEINFDAPTGEADAGAVGGVAGQGAAVGASFGVGQSAAPGQAAGQGLTGVEGVTGAVSGPSPGPSATGVSGGVGDAGSPAGTGVSGGVADAGSPAGVGDAGSPAGVGDSGSTSAD